MSKSTATEAHQTLRRTLIDLRRTQGFSQAELAERIGRGQSFVSSYEVGERRIDVIEFYAIVRALEADPVAVFAHIAERLPFSLDI